MSKDEYKFIEYQICGSHQYRGCHEETCCCSTDLVLVEKRKSPVFPYSEYKSVIANIDTYEEGNELIKILNREREKEIK
jgi:hypothetical protein